jgi:hypothetical protein
MISRGFSHAFYEVEQLLGAFGSAVELGVLIDSPFSDPNIVTDQEMDEYKIS